MDEKENVKNDVNEEISKVENETEVKNEVTETAEAKPETTPVAKAEEVKVEPEAESETKTNVETNTEKSKKKKNKKVLITIIILVIAQMVLIGAGIGIMFALVFNVNTISVEENQTSNAVTTNTTSKNTTDNKTNNTSKTNTNSNTNTTAAKAETKEEAYVVKNKITVLSKIDNLSNPVYTYTTTHDEEAKLIDVGVKFEKSSASYKFYDYSVSKADKDGNVTVTFKYDMTVPVKYEIDPTNRINFYYSFMVSYPVLFDYYTGQIYLRNEYEQDDKDTRKMKYNEIKWNGKTTKIGVRVDKTYKWDGQKETSENHYSDTCRRTITYTVSMPKNYDGLMVAIEKAGTTKTDFEATRSYNGKYEKLENEAKETGKESAEYKKMKELKNTMIKLHESRLEGVTYKATDFYVFKVSSIKKAAEKK